MTDLLPRCIVPLVVALSLAPVAGAQLADGAPSPPPLIEVDPWTHVPLRIWGFDDAFRRYNEEVVFARPLELRPGHQLRGAKLTLRLAEQPSLDTRIIWLQILAGWGTVARLHRSDLISGPRTLELPVNDVFLEHADTLYFHWILDSPGDPCQARVSRGSWGVIEDARLDLRLEPDWALNQLDRLPWPFFDPWADREPTVRIHLATDAPDPALLAAASMVAGYFGAAHGGPGIHVAVSWDTRALPEGHAVIVGRSQQVAALLGTTNSEPPPIDLIHHPGADQNGYKLLLVHGPDDPGLAAAAARLDTFLPRIAADASPIEFLPGRARPPEEGEPGPDPLVVTHQGAFGETLQQAFRFVPRDLSPDVRGVELDLEVTQLRPRPFRPARLDVELNGHHLTTLEPAEDCLPRPHTLWLPRHQLRTVNQLSFHVAATQVPPLCESWDYGETVQTSLALSPEPRLIGEGLDSGGVEAFARGGWPFSTDPTGSETTVVLPDEPLPGEVAAALSLVSHVAAATGRIPRELSVTTVGALQAASRDAAPGEAPLRHLLVVGKLDRLPATDGWSDALSQARRAMELGVEGVAAAAETPETAVVLSLPSPLDGERRAILVTALDGTHLPAGADLQAYTEIHPTGVANALVLERNHAAYRDLTSTDPEAADGGLEGEEAAACRAGSIRPTRAGAGFAALVIVGILGFCLRFSRRE